MTTLVIPLGIDWHTHVRQNHPGDDRLNTVIPDLAEQFGGAIIMPNTKPHIITVDAVLAYKRQIVQAIRGHSFLPLMTISLTKDITPGDLQSCLDCEEVIAVKFYAGTTTNADGIDNIEAFAWAFAMIEKSGKPLLLHGETAHPIEIMDREQRFYETSGPWIVDTFPGLKVSCEHMSTEFLVNFVLNARDGVVGTITGHHLHTTLTDILGRGVFPDRACMPTPKLNKDKAALRKAATSGNPKFFLGTDSAPHPMFGTPGDSKYSERGCSGCYSGPQGVALYAQAFEEEGSLDKLEAFASSSGSKFYGILAPKGRITLTKGEWELPKSYPFGKGEVAPYRYRDDGMVFWKSTRIA